MVKNTLTKTLVVLLLVGLSLGSLGADELDDALFGGDTSAEESTEGGDSSEEGNLDDMFNSFDDDSDSDSDSENLDDMFGSSDEDDMFGGDDDLLGDIGENIDNPEDMFFEDNSGFTIGGKINAKIGMGLTYNDFLGKANLAEDGDNMAIAGLDSTMYLSARPDDNFRFYLKVDTAYPFETNTKIRELFSEFNYDDTVYFRVGKQTVNWGVGYFFSPADVISLEAIDIEDAEADREGPVAIYANMPFGVNNLDFYTIIPKDADFKDFTIADMAFAGRGTMLVGNTELGLGAYYQYDHAPKGMLTVSSSIEDFKIFGEAVISYGTDKNIIESTIQVPTGDPDFPVIPVATYKNLDDQVFFNGTIGTMYMNSDWNFTGIAQYFFNGEGNESNDYYMDALTLVYLKEMTKEDVSNYFRHYAAAMLAWTELFETDFGFSSLAMMNLQDMSGLVKNTISYELFDYASISVGAYLLVGEDGGQYTHSAMPFRMAYDITLNIGSGTF